MTLQSLPSSSVHRIAQTRILEWVAISFSRGSSQPRDRGCISCIADRFFTTEPLGKPWAQSYQHVSITDAVQCFWTVVLEKTLESPLDTKEIKPVNPKINQPWIVIGRTDAEAEAPVFWLPDVKSQLLGKDPNAGKDWGQEENGGNRGWDSWMAPPTQWTWVWANFGR